MSETAGTQPAEDYRCIFFYGNGSDIHQSGTIFVIRVYMGIKSAFKRGEIDNYTTKYIHSIVCPWYNIINLNGSKPNSDKRDDTKDSFYEKLQCVLDQS
jgi:hypothetical protein